MVRKRVQVRVDRKKAELKKPQNNQDPTSEEIWGVGGLAEQERMKRPQTRWPEWQLLEREEVRE